MPTAISTDAAAGGGERSVGRGRWAGPLLAAAVLAPGGVGLVVLFRRLSAMDNSSEMFLEHAQTIWRGAMFCGALVAGLCAALLAAGEHAVTRTMRIAAWTGLVALGAGFVLWRLPIPFAPQRFVTLLLLAFAGARLAISSLRPRRRGNAAPALWASGAAAVGAVALAAMVPLLTKLYGLWWAFAVD